MSATDLGPEGRERGDTGKRRRRPSAYRAWKQTEAARATNPTVFALERERLTGMPRWHVLTDTPAEVAARRNLLREYTKRGGSVPDRTCRHCGGQIPNRTAKRFCSVACYHADQQQNKPTRPVCKCGNRRPDGQPLCGLCTRRAATAAHIENVEWLLSQGESPWQVLIRLNTNVRQLSALLRRHGRYDLAEAFYRIEAEARSAA